MDEIKKLVQDYIKTERDIKDLKSTQYDIEYKLCRELIEYKSYDLLKPNWPRLKMSLR